tara:strand:+ start:653 stop:1480 length:828 start_codon:yes stop_codon:yes gene_type:complete
MKNENLMLFENDYSWNKIFNSTSRKIKYPIYIPSKGRYYRSETAEFLIKENINFYFVVEPLEYNLYKEKYPEASILKLERDNYGTVVEARKFCKKHAKANGFDYHWQIDDNIRKIWQNFRTYREKAITREVIINIESFVDNHTNIGIAGISHPTFFKSRKNPFKINKQIACFVLIMNKCKSEWRIGGYDDTDFSLQVLTEGFCTVLFNIYLMDKISTGTKKGGHTEFYTTENRLKIAEDLQSKWPEAFKINYKYGYAKISPSQIWKRFAQTLIKR